MRASIYEQRPNSATYQAYANVVGQLLELRRGGRRDDSCMRGQIISYASSNCINLLLRQGRSLSFERLGQFFIFRVDLFPESDKSAWPFSSHMFLLECKLPYPLECRIL